MAGEFLLTVALILGVAASPLATETSTCTRAEELAGICSEVEGDDVILTGTDNEDGSSGGSGGTGAEDVDVDNDYAACIGQVGNPGDETCDGEIPPITIIDIAAFTPTPGQQRMEPDGWTVAGLHTNFYALTSTHVVNGRLLGRPAAVRFTPVSYHWAYGDGERATKGTKGGTWAALRIAEFERTPTSHVYDELDDYTITLDITFAAEYRFDGGPWTPVIGTITLPANDLHVRVGTAKTVLVEHDCAQDPSGPGC